MNYSEAAEERKSLLVTGATGFIGSRFSHLAMDRGHEVHTFTRSDWSHQPAVPVRNRCFGKLPNQISPEVLQGIEVIVHFAGVSQPGDQASHAVNVTGTLNLARMAIEAGSQTFVFLSSQSAHPDALSSYGRSKYTAERELLKLRGINVVILRPGLVCGPGSRGLYRRMCALVEALPIIPLPGGGGSIVQPIHIDDLCEAIFRSVVRSRQLAGSILSLGDEAGMSLSHFLRAITLARLGRRKIVLPLPLWPVELALRAAERIGLPLPVNSNNLKGMKGLRRMATGVDMARLKLQPRSIEAIVKKDEGAVHLTGPLALDRRALRVLVIGAGRVGLVHAVTLSRLPGFDLIGLIDRQRRPLNLLRGMGLTEPAYSSLEDALNQEKADAAVIATPPSTHFDLTQACLMKGLSVLVEKPLAFEPKQLADYEQLSLAFPNLSVQVGYVMALNPQVSSYIDRLKAGEFGQVKGFLGFSLLSFIQQQNIKRWEVERSISGGGAMINSGGHVLSMIHDSFGQPGNMAAQLLRLHSLEVEDSMVVNFEYPGFRGVHFCSWSIGGYSRQENKLLIWTERGLLCLTGSVGLFMPKDGKVEIRHQLDFDVAFNLAPDYSGAGFSTELADLERSVRTGQTARMNVAKAIGIEKLLFKIYADAQTVTRFKIEPSLENLIGKTISAEKASVLRLSDASGKQSLARILDLRDLSEIVVCRNFSHSVENGRWDGYQLTPSQLSGLPSTSLASTCLRVTVPDFLQYSRFLLAGKYSDVLRKIGLKGVFYAGLTALPMVIGERGLKFWGGVLGLLAADLAGIPSSFDGSILLHNYITDLALAVERRDVLDRMLNTCRRLCPQARVGFHTNLAGEAANLLPQLEEKVDEISILTSPHGRHLSDDLCLLRQGLQRGSRLVAEVGLAPAIVHQIAARSSKEWYKGADAILLGLAADEDYAALLKAEKKQAWSEAFPGVKMPDTTL